MKSMGYKGYPCFFAVLSAKTKAIGAGNNGVRDKGISVLYVDFLSPLIAWGLALTRCKNVLTAFARTRIPNVNVNWRNAGL
jgi:hypothetical protein